MKKIIDFIKKYKRALLELLLLIGTLVVVSCLIIIVLWACGIVTFSGGFSFNSEKFEVLSTAWYGYLLFYVIHVIGTLLLCFAPIGTLAFLTLGLVAYGPGLATFLLLLAGVVTSSILLDFVGRFGGHKFAEKIFGDERFAKGQKILKEKGMIYLPIMYLLPLFPDDLLCCLAGTVKINFWYHLVIIIFGRGAMIAVLAFGLDIIPYENFTSVWDWIVAITCLVVWLYFIFKFTRRIDKKYMAHRGKKIAKEEKNQVVEAIEETSEEPTLEASETTEIITQEPAHKGAQNK